MTRVKSAKGRLALVLAVLAAGGIIAAYSGGTAAADGRTLTGDFCTTPNAFCMTLTWQDVAYGTPNRADLSLRPGEYWLTLDDTSTHDFALRSCPGSTLPCDSNNPVATTTELTTSAEIATVTDKIQLTFGTYRLYCDLGAGTPFAHEGRGMYVDFEVGGVGQLDNS
jgi:hypothetical protein